MGNESELLIGKSSFCFSLVRNFKLPYLVSNLKLPYLKGMNPPRYGLIHKILSLNHCYLPPHKKMLQSKIIFRFYITCKGVMSYGKRVYQS